MILYRDERWLAVDKPCGMATHAPHPGELGAVEWLALHRDETAHVVSRLDRGTSGVLLLARDAAASADAQRIHEEGSARKTYDLLTVVPDDAEPPARWESNEPVDGKDASTLFTLQEIVAPGPGARALSGGALANRRLARYRAEISRGRRHQIRIHAATAGLPLLGDDGHGGLAWPRLCLHCSEVAWPDLTEPLRAPLPLSFRLLLREHASADELGLAVCADRRGAWPAAVTDAWRLVHRGEIAHLPLAVDRYGEWLSAVWFDESRTPGPGGSLDTLLERLAAGHGCRGCVLRIHRRNPHQHGLSSGKRVLGETPPDTLVVTEHGLRYEIDLLRTQHTGLFLDQRDSRRWLQLRARGARLANLFAFTCSFSVVGAAAGAEVAFSVDVARPCLNTGKTNFELNGLSESGRGKFIQEDARRWLQRQLRRRAEGRDFAPLDLVVCDPPVFASSKDGGKFSVENEWPALAAAAADLLADDGAALFANNHRSGDESAYRRALRDAFAEVVPQRPPLDFPVLGGSPPHVRIYACSRPIRDRRGPSRPRSER